MDKEWMAKQLPEEPPEELLRWVKFYLRDEIGPEFLVFHAERVSVQPTFGEILEHNSTAPRRTEWAAFCSCTACREDFYTQKVPGLDAVCFTAGDDGMLYTLEPGETAAEMQTAMAGEILDCPLCGSRVELIHSRELRGGRTKRVKVQTIQNVAGYTTVFYWMVVRRVWEYGTDYMTVEPMDAYVLTEKGGLVRYSHARGNSFGGYTQYARWKLMSNCKDSHDQIYQDWGSTFNRKSGAAFYDRCPELGGTTGEKTGLQEYIAGGGCNIVQYLKFWRRHRNIENIIKAGQAQLVAGIFRRASSYCYSVEMEMEKYLDLQECKPNRMLRISKEELRQIQEQGISLKVQHMDLFNNYRARGGTLKLTDFLETAADFGERGMRAVMDIMRQTPGADLPKIARYLAKQNLRPEDVQHLVDARAMARNLFAPRELTQEELWPRNLTEVHDRLVQMEEERRKLRSQKEREEQVRKFREVIEKYGDLLWNDGELCILLPESPEDLHREGSVLRHCVGGYANRHVSGSDTIFFVRRYRRPERCYYTLDIRLDQGEPKEVQLHGYGNERHGKHKEYEHRIPQKVRKFVDRWEREVLMPWYIRRIQSETKEKTA